MERTGRIVAGLLNMEPDDMKIPESFREAEKLGLNSVLFMTQSAERIQTRLFSTFCPRLAGGSGCRRPRSEAAVS